MSLSSLRLPFHPSFLVALSVHLCRFEHQNLLRAIFAGQQSCTPPASPSRSVQAALRFWQLLLTIMAIIANFCENWHIWQLKCHMPYRIFFGRFPHLYNRWMPYKSASLLIHAFPVFFFLFLSVLYLMSLCTGTTS